MCSDFSLIPARITIEIKKPNDVPNEHARLSAKLYPLSMLEIATPKTAQFVVISGRYTPSASYQGLMNFFKIISTS